MSAARIGKVRMKSGGAEVRVLSWKDPGLSGHCLLSTARDAVKAGNIIAYAVVALFDDGHIYSDCRTKDIPADMLMNRHAFVGMVTEAVRDDLIAYEAARQVVNLSNGYGPDTAS